jgi:hypothetical protein
MLDEFSNYYSDYVVNNYDCVDRIILNGYFSLGHNPGGFREWWRRLKGSDDDLTDTHLMRLAGRMSRRIRGYAKANGIPLEDCHKGSRKHEIAEKYIPKDPNFTGVFLILVNRAPGVVWHVQRSEEGNIRHIVRRKPLPYVNHFSFHIMDPEWGHITIKLCGHPPFAAQIMLNGHEYVSRQAKNEGVVFTKDGNCFTNISDARRLSLVADTLSHSDGTIGHLRQVCERWIYSSCLCFGLDLAEQERSGFVYDYSIYQMEYSRNLLFRRGRELDQVFDGIIDRTRSKLNVKTLRTIFGTSKRPHHRKSNRVPRLEVVLEKPRYDLTVFKLHFGKFTVKLYTKGECVLRVEVIVHNAKVLTCGRSLEKFPRIVVYLQDILVRFLDQLHCIDISSIADTKLEELPYPSQVGKTRVGGIDINKSRIKAVMEAVIELSVVPNGFSSSDLAIKVQERTGYVESQYTSRKAAYDLKKFRGKKLVRKITNSRKYETVPDGLRAMTALLVLTDKVIKPVLAGTGKGKPGPKPKTQSKIDIHYQNLQMEMRYLFCDIGIAA